VRADERLCSDILLSTLLSCACCCRQECLCRRLIQFVNRTVMAYPWHELSALAVSEVPPPSRCRPALYGVEFLLEAVSIFSSVC
jgi:hypothetical protein